MAMDIIGWLSAACLILCGVPLATRAWKDKHVRGISTLFIFLWTVGELLGIIYVWGNLPLMANYGFNLGVCLILLRYWNN